MKKKEYEFSVKVPVSREQLWSWHMQPGAFERLMPPWQKLSPEELPDRMTEGASVRFKIHSGPLKINWLGKIEKLEPPICFVDRQVKGPFGYWRHEHLFSATGTQESRLTDRVSWSLPRWGGWIPGSGKLATRELERLFAFRHARMVEDLKRHKGALPGSGRIVLITGSTGLIGSRLVPYLRTLGFEVRGLTRGKTNGSLFHWDPRKGEIDPEAMKGVDALIHLAGENIASGRWTEERRRRILQSRKQGTRTLVREIAKSRFAPRVLVSASGVNYYAADGEIKTELSSPGTGFLSQVCREWEGEAKEAQQYGVRTVFVRTGVVLDPMGGALGKMLPVFRLGGGGPIGHGRQSFPWISMDDLLDVYLTCLLDEESGGAINAVSPGITSQREFANCLGEVLGRPSFMRLPAFLVKMIFGKMGEETLLGDLKVKPAWLLEKGFPFRQPRLREALTQMLGRVPV